MGRLNVAVRKNKFLLGLIGIITVSTFLTAFYILRPLNANDEGFFVRYEDNIEKSYTFSFGNHEVCQEINWSGNLKGVQLFFDVDPAVDNNLDYESIIKVKILDEEENLLVQSEDKCINIANHQWTEFHFDNPVNIPENQSFKLVLEVNVSEDINSLSIYYSNYLNSKVDFDNSKIEDVSLSINIMQEYGGLFNYYYIVVCLLFLISIVVIHYLFFTKKIKLYIVAFVSIILLGSIYNLVYLPFTIPDEESHYATAYNYSNILLGYKGVDFKNDVVEIDGKTSDYVVDGDVHTHSHYIIEARETDASAFKSTSRYFGKYRPFIDKLISFETNINNDDDAFEECVLNTPFVMYIPSILGITVGRLCGMNGAITMLMGRFFNLLLFSLMVMFAIKKTPKAKTIMFAIALLPMTLSLAASFSYDGMLIGASFLFLSEVMNLSFNNKNVSIQDTLLILTCSLIFGLDKVIYSPLLLLLLIPILRETSFVEKKKLFLLLILSVIFALIGVIISQLPTLGHYVEKLVTSNRYSISFILTHPLHFISITVRTLVDQASYFLSSIIGYYRGLSFTWSIVILFWLILVLIIILNKKENYTFSLKEIIIIIFSIILVGLLLFLVATTWNNKYVSSIGGLQGRYFLPLLPIIFILFSRVKSNFIIKNSDERKYLILEMTLHILCFTTAFAFVY